MRNKRKRNIGIIPSVHAQSNINDFEIHYINNSRLRGCEPYFLLFIINAKNELAFSKERNKEMC